MVNTATEAIDYFSAPQGYFWKWAENGKVTEDAGGKTICYREDLVSLLGELPKGTRFPLGAIILILYACNDNWDESFGVSTKLMPFSVKGSSGSEKMSIYKLNMQARLFLSTVNKLPFEARSGIRRIALLQAVIASLPVDESCPDLYSVLLEFKTGALDDRILNSQSELSFDVIRRDFEPLVKALSIFPGKATLELKLRTGLTTIPAPAPIQIPENETGDLLGQLEQDAQTQALAMLARKIMAALQIPMHLDGISDQALGGVSDISNKGTFDKLLLSELAQDDTLLTARLANGEALFLQRETPPNNTVQELGIFIDITLKMWGMPRIFAIAAALAFRESKQKNQHLGVWALGGKSSREVSIDTRDGVTDLMEKLDPVLHCGEQLVKVARQQFVKNGKYIFITGEDFMLDTVALSCFLRIKEQLNFLVTVGRAGRIQLFKLNKGGQKLINEAQLNLQEILFHSKRTLKNYKSSGIIPAIMQSEPFPLYFPTSKVQISKVNTYETSQKGVVIISLDRRVLHWPDKNHGALELVEFLDYGGHCFGEIDNVVYIALKCRNIDLMKIFSFELQEESRFTTVCEIEPRYKAIHSLAFIDKKFYLKANLGFEIIDPINMQVIQAGPNDEQIFKNHEQVTPYYKNFNLIRKYVNTGYSVINSIHTLFIHDGWIYIDKRNFCLQQNQFFWVENKNVVAWTKPPKQEILNIENMPNIKFSKFVWENGGEIILDSRGLLHLKSADTSIPEICILLIIDKSAACWSADGVVSGPDYFTGKGLDEQMDPPIFYRNYIFRFINSLK